MFFAPSETGVWKNKKIIMKQGKMYNLEEKTSELKKVNNKNPQQRFRGMSDLPSS